jgi:hypothetical protein
LAEERRFAYNRKKGHPVDDQMTAMVDGHLKMGRWSRLLRRMIGRAGTPLRSRSCSSCACGWRCLTWRCRVSVRLCGWAS